MKLNKDDRILFIGDSVTDANRDKTKLNSLGDGYVNILGHHHYPDLEVINKGVNGNKVYELADRWYDDCISLQPDILSILIGVNDHWWTLESTYAGNIDIYKNDYRNLLKSTLIHLPNVKLIIGEPFALRMGVVGDNWYPEFYEYQKAAKDIAQEFGAIFVSYQKVFDAVLKRTEPRCWTMDGVHPNLAGAKLMATIWADVVEKA